MKNPAGFLSEGRLKMLKIKVLKNDKFRVFGYKENGNSIRIDPIEEGSFYFFYIPFDGASISSLDSVIEIFYIEKIDQEMEVVNLLKLNEIEKDEHLKNGKYKRISIPVAILENHKCLTCVNKKVNKTDENKLYCKYFTRDFKEYLEQNQCEFYEEFINESNL